MIQHAAGTFTVQLTPAPNEEGADADALLGRMLIQKEFHGDLEATSQGQMLTAGTAVAGSAGYVAIERVTGTLHGRSGSFVLQHHGLLARGAPQQIIAIVPDSGTEQLVDLAGTMTIIIVDGAHSYVIEYSLAAVE